MANYVLKPGVCFSNGRYVVEKSLSDIVYEIKDIVKNSTKLMKTFASDIKKISQSEFELITRLYHPNVCAYYDIINISIGVTGVIYELNEEGELLSNLVRSVDNNGEKISDSKAISWSRQILEALDFLHSNDILHKNLKTSNVLIENNSTVKITDIDPTDTKLPKKRQSTQTPGGQQVARDEAENYTSKTDIWSFGCILYEILSLRKPPLNLTDKAASGSSSSRQLTDILDTRPNSKHRALFTSLLTNSLEENQEKRYSARQLLNVIDQKYRAKANQERKSPEEKEEAAASNNEGSSDSDDSDEEEESSKEAVDKELLNEIHRLILSGDRETNAESALSIYEQTLHKGTIEFQLENKKLFAECYMRISWEYRRNWEARRKEVAAQSYLAYTQKAFEFYEFEYENERTSRKVANCYRELDKAYNCNGMVNSTHMEKARKIYDSLGMKTSCDMGDCLVNSALAFNLASDDNKPDEDFIQVEFMFLNKARKIYDQQSDNKQKAYFLLRLGIAYGRTDDLKNEMKYVLEAYEMYQKLKLSKSPDAVYCLIVAAINCNLSGDHTQEEWYLQKVRKTCQDLDWFDKTQQANLLRSLAQACNLNNNHKQELEYLKEAIEIYESVGSVDKKHVADCYVRLGIAHNANSNYAEELNNLKKGYKIYQGLKIVTRQDHLDMAECKKCLGTAYGNNNNHDQELKFQMEAYKILHSLNLGESRDLADSLRRLAIAHDFQKNFRAEIDCLQRAELILESLDLTDGQDYAVCLMRLGMAYNNVKEYRRALVYHLKAREVFKKVEPISSELMAEFWLSLGVVYNNNERHKEALKYKRKAHEYYCKKRDDIQVAYCLKSLGQSYGLNTDNINELRYLREAYEMFKRLGLSQDPQMIGFLNSLAVAYFNNSNNDMFVKYSKKAKRLENSLEINY